MADRWWGEQVEEEKGYPVINDTWSVLGQPQLFSRSCLEIQLCKEFPFTSRTEKLDVEFVSFFFFKKKKKSKQSLFHDDVY